MISKTDRAMFNIARNISELSDHPHHHLGAVVVQKHRVISTGYNSVTKVDPLQARMDSRRYGCTCRGCLHAETMALLPLIKSNADLRGAKVYVYRELKNGSPAMARPCDGCMSLIQEIGICKIAYSTNGGFAKEYL